METEHTERDVSTLRIVLCTLYRVQRTRAQYVNNSVYIQLYRITLLKKTIERMYRKLWLYEQYNLMFCIISLQREVSSLLYTRVPKSRFYVSSENVNLSFVSEVLSILSPAKKHFSTLDVSPRPSCFLLSCDNHKNLIIELDACVAKLHFLFSCLWTEKLFLQLLFSVF